MNVIYLESDRWSTGGRRAGKDKGRRLSRAGSQLESYFTVITGGLSGAQIVPSLKQEGSIWSPCASQSWVEGSFPRKGQLWGTKGKFSKQLGGVCKAGEGVLDRAPAPSVASICFWVPTVYCAQCHHWAFLHPHLVYSPGLLGACNGCSWLSIRLRRGSITNEPEQWFCRKKRFVFYLSCQWFIWNSAQMP